MKMSLAFAVVVLSGVVVFFLYIGHVLQQGTARYEMSEQKNTQIFPYNFSTVGPFEHNGNETLTDTNTGRMWMEFDGPERVTWADAMQYCDSVTTGSHDDWRVPTISDLQTIFDYSRANPATSLPNIQAVHYWTATPYVPDDRFTWSVLMYTGGFYGNYKINHSKIRCVRDGELNRDAEIQSHLSQKVNWADPDTIPTDPMTWDAAKEYCESVATTSTSGVQGSLPSVRDMQLILEYTAFDPALISTYKDEVDSDEYWTSDGVAGIETMKLFAGVRGGNIGPAKKTELKRVWCVER